MSKPDSVEPQALLALLGQPVTAAPVQAMLQQLAHGMQPELDPDEPEKWVDWVTVNELGLEFGFEDEAYVRALDIGKRGSGPMLLTQVYFYGDTARTMPYPYPLPFGLTLEDDRATVRRKLAAHDGVRRSYLRDAWALPEFDLTVAYEGHTGRVTSVLCQVPYTPWPALKDEAERVAAFPPSAFIKLFGERWSNQVLRSQLAPFGYEQALPDVRSEHTADWRVAHGLELGFAPGREVRSADPRFPTALALASVTYYGSRVLDARAWAGTLPFDLSLTDSQAQLAAKLGRPPDERADEDLTGHVVWHEADFSLIVEYSNLVNHIMRIMVAAPGYWSTAHTEATA